MRSAGNPTNINEIIDKHGQSIRRLCKAYLGYSEDVDDLYQEVLINIWSSIKSFKNQSKLSTWIYRVTINTAITFRKKRDRKSSFENQIVASDMIGNDPNDRLEKIKVESQINHLQNAINQLDQLDKLVIGMVLESISYKEIAEVIGKDTSFVGVKITRIKTKLQKLMASQTPFET